MKTLILAVVVTVTTSACAHLGRKSDEVPPQLWSDHKAMPVPVGVCAERAYNVLSALGYSSVVKNGNYSYGNMDGNRAAVKCVETSGSSFVYFAVAGPQRDKVEELRNAIARKL